MKHISIAIDGPAGAGKSTIARAAAGELKFIYIDTGAMYRAVGLYAKENKIDTQNKDGELEAHLNDIKIDISYIGGSQHIFLNGEDVSEKIRTPEISMAASDVATVKCVREKLVELQRELAKSRDVIMDGRDIGTHVLPGADLKIYLTASSDARAMRRYRELLQKGQAADINEVKKDIIARDKNDSEREFSPLRCAPDATVLDTSDMTLEESVRVVIKMIKECI